MSSNGLASTERVKLVHPDTHEMAWAWLCMCGCAPHADGMCVLESNEDCDHVKVGDLIYAHLSCVAPRMEPLAA